MKILDPHLHLFDLQLGQYDWLKAENAPFWPDKSAIVHNFSEQDLVVSKNHEVAGFVHVEAGFDNDKPINEIKWLESSVTRPFKSIAFVDLTLPTNQFERACDDLRQCNSVTAVRYILDDQAIEILSLAHVQSNFAYLAKHKLSFDLQMPLADLKAVTLLTNLLALTPTLKVIINHAGWPPAEKSNGELMQSDWYTGLKRLSALTQCAVKCSGWEMIDRQYDALPEQLTSSSFTKIDSWQSNVLSLCLKTFGHKRVMLASNFPLCLFHSSYQTYWDNLIDTLDKLGLAEQKKQALVFNNACSWYNLTI